MSSLQLNPVILLLSKLLLLCEVPNQYANAAQTLAWDCTDTVSTLSDVWFRSLSTRILLDSARQGLMAIFSRQFECGQHVLELNRLLLCES